MDIRQLEMFLSVTDNQSFSKAAKMCCVSQSAVSQQIKMLEDELCAPLFVRESRGVVLTDEGHELYERAKHIIRDVLDAKEHVQGIHGDMTGTLRIGVGAFVEQFIKHACMEMCRKYPNVLLKIEFGHAIRLNQLLRTHEIDLAFSMNTAYKDEGIVTEPIIPFRLCAIMNRTHQLASKGLITFDDICRNKVILLDAGKRVFETLQKYMDADISRMKIGAIVGCAEAALNVASEMNLITFMPASYVANKPHMVAIPIEHLQKDLTSNVHYMHDVAMKRTARAFMEIVRNESVPFVKMQS